MHRALTIVIIAMCLVTAACDRTDTKSSNVSDVDYTVVDRAAIPEELAATIDARKESDFEISACIDGYTYIVKGYGKQPTGGYSIRVDRLQTNGTDMTMASTLIGPSAGEAVNKLATYPYIVIKTEATDNNILFE